MYSAAGRERVGMGGCCTDLLAVGPEPHGTMTGYCNTLRRYTVINELQYRTVHCAQAKLQALEEEGQGGEAGASAAGGGAIAWRGTTSVVSTERVRAALGQALELSKQVKPL